MDITKIYGIKVFSDAVMSQRLPRDVYESLKLTQRMGTELDSTIAGAVAAAMRDWAVENGATHYSHWFQPMTNITAGKHEAFIMPDNNNNGNVIMEFSSKDLIQSEPDASSFPNGGLRATFEARGYTSWDPTSPAFIRDQTLFIPTAFCSYTGLALDTKTPQLRSMAALNKQGIRLLRALGNTTSRRLAPYCGNEQEYFLVDKKMYNQREDLRMTGRTLFGAKPPRGQELDDHYYGAIRPRVAAFMKDLDENLWALGIYSKTKHNEAAPAQHEMAPVYTDANTACDHNQLTMEVMKKIAEKHDLVCLLDEKPFAGVNGSGKHDNWSLSTDTGKNLLDPGKKPQENTLFLLFLAAIIKGVDEYQDLLRISVASAGNDHRLGANEAPPAIVSMFLGDELEGILEAIEKDEPYTGIEAKQLQTGVHVLPDLAMDTTDRNRTSPFAFTGNKFEFRMLGSSQSIASPNVVLNTIMAQELEEFADILEQSNDFRADLQNLLHDTFKAHQRIIFDGNGYGGDWVREAQRRGLSNLRDTVDCMPAYIDPKNIRLFSSHNILSETEMRARYEIHLENYCKVTSIEAATLRDMVMRGILPAVNRYTADLTQAILRKRELVVPWSSARI